jgi:glycosyltransferase involved in cell wall biosynthesis
MDIIVCGAQKPFVRGGAEMHMDNLVAAFNEHGHRAELVRLPVAWERARLFDAPTAWRLLPLDADLVVATNFPSYFAQHPNKVVWLFHQHRGAYDGADAAWSDFDLDDDSLETQRLLTEWDSVALGEARKVFTTSGVVADRLARFNGIAGEPLYHPPPLADRLHPGDFGDVVFCPSRLEHNKRPGLMVDALPLIDHSVSLSIAGRGMLHDELVDAATRSGAVDRLDLPGFISDEDLIKRYASCLAVIYAPADEDYGYVTLQAFFAGKPVITAADSGGVLEWVDDGVNGFVTDGTPAGIAEAVNRLAADRDLAARMGEAGRQRVADLGWGPVVERLTAS